MFLIVRRAVVSNVSAQTVLTQEVAMAAISQTAEVVAGDVPVAKKWIQIVQKEVN